MNLKTPHAKRVRRQPKGTQWSLLFFAGLSFFLIFRLFIPRYAFLKERQNPYNNQTAPVDVTIDLPAAETSTTNLHQWPSIVEGSLTAILPVNFDSLSMLEGLLRPFLKPSRNLREIMIICPENLILQVRGALRNTVSSSADHPDISLHAFVGGLDHQTGVVNAVSRASTDWVLLMDHQGLLRQSDSTTHILLHPSGTPTPTGPRGVSISASNVSCIITLDGPEKASYLLPPFLMPSFFATNELPSSGLDVWASLGAHISNSNSDRIGGVVIKSGDYTTEWCPIPTHAAFNLLDSLRWNSLPFNDSQPNPCLAGPLSSDSGVFAFFIPTIRDLQSLGPLMCLLQSSGHRVNLFVYHDADGLSDAVVWEGRTYMSDGCSLSYGILPGFSTLSTTFQVHLVALDWLSTLDERPDIIVGPSHEDILDRVSMAKHEALREAVVVRIPKEDFPYCMWMGSLSITEWRGRSYPTPLLLFLLLTIDEGWKIPHVDISIITKDRPKSLSRLLHSLSNGRFFGDSANIRINLEQSADMETMKLAEGFSWPRGSVFTHHRVIHGGLLPAVVESWYPGSNDTYGLLLEDDVELSPLFYAWVKMSILRYRYEQGSWHLFLLNRINSQGMAILTTALLDCLVSASISKRTLSSHWKDAGHSTQGHFSLPTAFLMPLLLISPLFLVVGERYIFRNIGGNFTCIFRFDYRSTP